MSARRILLTGASGFVGRHLIAALDDARVFALARRSQRQSRVPCREGLTWLQADIGDYSALESAFRTVAEHGGADVLVHLAAHYDFTGEEHAEYWRTNVHGMRNTLMLAAGHGIRRVVFPSSLAACRFPPLGGALDERSAPDGEHIYARTKRAGEEMLREFEDRLSATVIRFAAMFSDWCEYAPLFVFLQTWLGSAWNRRILGGRGRSAIPYLHVRDGVSFLRATIEREDLGSHEVVVASPDGSVSHEELYEVSTRLHFAERRAPLHMPRALCGPGIWARDTVGRILGERPFERPWMARYIDLRMNVDASRTRARLGWAPRPRLGILRRLPFLIENMKAEPVEWHCRNHAALKAVRLRPNLQVYTLLRRHASSIAAEFTEVVTGDEGRRRFPGYQRLFVNGRPLERHELLLRHLLDAVRTRERAVLVSYCRDLGEEWHALRLRPDELCEALRALDRICVRTLSRDPDGDALRPAIRDLVSATLDWACDEVQEVHERLGSVENGEFPA